MSWPPVVSSSLEQMMSIRTGVVATLAIALGSLNADAQVIGSFTWQMQPYCNRVVLTVVQQGAVYQLTGVDDQCGTGSAPVTGTAVPAGGGVAMGFTVAQSSGRAAHVSSTVSLATLSGTWSDGDGNTGPFAFYGAGGGAPRPAPSATSSILVTQFSPTVYGGTGTAPTVARSDHTHDDRYYTKAQVDAAINAARAATATTAYTAYGAGPLADGIIDFAAVSGSPTDVVTLNLPAGNYIVAASAVLNNNVAALTNVDCSLRLGGTAINVAFTQFLSNQGTGGEREQIALTGAGNLASAGTAVLRCSTNATLGNYLGARIVAMNVGAVVP